METGGGVNSFRELCCVINPGKTSKKMKDAAIHCGSHGREPTVRENECY